MILANELWELVRAGFSGIWIETQEATEAIFELSQLVREHDLCLMRWNLDCGLVGIDGQSDGTAARDPLSVIRSLQSVTDDRSTLLILENFHRFVDSAEICQALQTQLLLGKQTGRHIVIVSPTVKLPAELERQFVVLQHALPTKDQLRAIAESLVTADASALPESMAGQLIDAASGLTRAEAESAFSLSLVRRGHLAADEVWGLKGRWLRKNGLLSMHRSEHGFETLGGLESLKQFCLRSLNRRSKEGLRVNARGLLLLGVPGTGKSAFAKALGKETTRPVLCLDVGALMGSLVGQTEHNIRQALQTADAMAPCVLFVDEVEKALSGVASGGRGDGGVSSRLFGTLLTWLNDHTSDVYVVMTCNNIKQLPPEFSRAERFDAIMFLDLPVPRSVSQSGQSAEPSMRSMTAIQHRPMKVGPAPRSKHAADSVCCLVSACARQQGMLCR